MMLKLFPAVVWPPINRTIVTEVSTNINFSADICIGKEQPTAIIRPMVVEMLRRRTFRNFSHLQPHRGVSAEGKEQPSGSNIPIVGGMAPAV